MLGLPRNCKRCGHIFVKYIERHRLCLCSIYSSIIQSDLIWSDLILSIWIYVFIWWVLLCVRKCPCEKGMAIVGSLSTFASLHFLHSVRSDTSHSVICRHLFANLDLNKYNYVVIWCNMGYDPLLSPTNHHSWRLGCEVARERKVPRKSMIHPHFPVQIFICRYNMV